MNPEAAKGRWTPEEWSKIEAKFERCRRVEELQRQMKGDLTGMDDVRNDTEGQQNQDACTKEKRK